MSSIATAKAEIEAKLNQIKEEQRRLHALKRKVSKEPLAGKWYACKYTLAFMFLIDEPNETYASPRLVRRIEVSGSRRDRRGFALNIQVLNLPFVRSGFSGRYPDYREVSEQEVAEAAKKWVTDVPQEELSSVLDLILKGVKSNDAS